MVHAGRGHPACVKARGQWGARQHRVQSESAHVHVSPVSSLLLKSNLRVIPPHAVAFSALLLASEKVEEVRHGAVLAPKRTWSQPSSNCVPLLLVLCHVLCYDVYLSLPHKFKPIGSPTTSSSQGNGGYLLSKVGGGMQQRGHILPSYNSLFHSWHTHA